MDDREPDRMIVDEPVPPRVERETTIIQTGERGGSGGLIAGLVVLVLLAVGAFFVFGGGLERTADTVDVNVNVDVPKVEVPDIDINLPERPAEPAEGNKQ